MADFTVTLPSLGEDAGDTATVSFTYVDAGETIGKDDDLIEMVTDKATFNVPCPKDGTVKEVLVEEDQEVKVGAAIAILEIDE